MLHRNLEKQLYAQIDECAYKKNSAMVFIGSELIICAFCQT